MKTLVDERYDVRSFENGKWSNVQTRIGGYFSTLYEAQESMKRWKRINPLGKFKTVKLTTTEEDVE